MRWQREMPSEALPAAIEPAHWTSQRSARVRSIWQPRHAPSVHQATASGLAIVSSSPADGARGLSWTDTGSASNVMRSGEVPGGFGGVATTRLGSSRVRRAGDGTTCDSRASYMIRPVEVWTRLSRSRVGVCREARESIERDSHSLGPGVDIWKNTRHRTRPS